MFNLSLFKISPFVVYQKNGEGVISCYNWFNGESVDFFDINHPAFKLFNCETYPALVDNQEWEEDLRWLADAKFIVPKEGFPSEENILPKEEQNVLHLILLPAGEACNLRCVYCYEAHDDVQRMNDVHVDRIANLCEKNRGKYIRIEYFGGEPLLNASFITALAKRLKSMDIDFTASITTNGTLISERVLDSLYRDNVRLFQITIDGGEHTHNSLRPAYNSMENSFQKVCETLKILQKSKYKDLKILIRSNVNEKSISSNDLDEFFKIIQSIIPIDDDRFSFLFRPIGDYAAANNRRAIDQNSICSHNNSNEVTTTLEDFFESAGYLLSDTQMIMSAGGFSCYANQKNSFVISPDFTVKKCTVALDDPLNIVGMLQEDGKISFNEISLYGVKILLIKNVLLVLCIVLAKGIVVLLQT